MDPAGQWAVIAVIGKVVKKERTKRFEGLEGEKGFRSGSVYCANRKKQLHGSYYHEPAWTVDPVHKLFYDYHVTVFWDQI